MLPFSPPRIDQQTIDEVIDTLKSGWISTGPKTKLFEKKITEYVGCKTTVAVSAWTTGMEVALRWWGIGPGDEVIIPVYTYCASANVVLHTGATPVMVDIHPSDFNISLEAIKKAITKNTKAIMPVDIAGLPCDYDGIQQLVEEAKPLFQPANEVQKTLGRMLIAADAAHSFGATYKGRQMGSVADISCFSFHAVKNLTTAEGGAICFNLPDSFDHEELYKLFCIKILHGQSKDALAKMQKGAWRYDVLEPGYKCNMTDLQAAIGLVELARYADTLARRKEIFEQYAQGLGNEPWAEIPVREEAHRVSCCHLFQLNIKRVSESQRDAIMQEIFEQEVAVNVHFQPLALLTAYKNLGYDIANYPVAYDKYSREISLPIYYNLTKEQVDMVIQTVKVAYHRVMG
ncbi:MAG: DegT/DnrJ/EryC1/StrS aminotransferase family protein [Flavobacteriia bacterium]|nr:DegT/DnrJ/EryC1/StrS aminotransferase family protein [Flavobacteriia bacterium]